MGYKYLLDIALILLSTKLLGLLTRRVQLPQVVGALLAGLLLGPAVLGWITESEFIDNIAEVGVIVMMFSAGLGTDVRELKKSGLASFVIALLGVILPLIGGFFAAYFFNQTGDPKVFLQNIFIGVVLTATSVSISVETLKELGKLSTRTGNAILGAALIDDVLGIIALTVITSFADSTVNIWVVLAKILGFFLLSGVIALLFIKFVQPWINGYKQDLRRFAIMAFVLCLLMAYTAERFFGVSDITGAFIAGLILSNNKRTTYMIGKFDDISFLLLSPVFFASVGLKVTIGTMSASIILFSVVLLLVAVLTKIIGCGLGAKLCRYTNLQCVKIGIGMISRGEVALIVAAKGAALGLMPEAFFAPVIIMVVATTIITPILLKLIYRYQDRHPWLVEPHIESSLIEKHEEKEHYEMLTQNVSRLHEEMQEQKKK